MVKQRKIGRLDLAIWLGFMVFAVSAIIVAVTLPEISNTFSTDLSEGGGLETARNLVLLLVLLAAGMLAKRWGKKRFLTLGQYLMAIGLLLASFSQNYATLVAALFVIGLGGGFSEALLNPLITDLHKDEAGRYMNLSHAFYPGGIVVSALLFGELLTAGYSWRLMFQLSAGLTLILAVTLSVLPFPPQEQDESSYLETFGKILRIKGFWLFAAAIFLGGSIESALMFWSRTYVESYLSDIPRSGAVAVVIFAGAMATGRFITSYLANKTTLTNIMTGSAVLGLVVSALIPLTSNLLGFYLLLALAGIATACFWPTILAEADSRLTVNTTILFVLLACSGIIGFGSIPWILGTIGDSSELRTGFATIPVLFAGLMGIFFLDRYFTKRRQAANPPVDSKTGQGTSQ